MIPDTTEVTRIAIALRITAATLPDFCHLCGCRVSNSAFGLKQLSYKGLTRLCGVVSGVTAAVKYTKSTRYICPNEECEGHYGNKYVRVHIPGASEKEMVGHGFNCCACGAALKEVQSQRTLSDDLCSEVTLGQYCELVGTQRAVHKDENITYMFEVNNFIRTEEDGAGSLVLAREGVCRICGDIRALKRADKQELQTAMSENRVQVALESRHTGSLPCVLQIPLACQVWAHTAGSDSVPNSSSFLGACAIPDIPTSLSEAFSVISIGESVGWDSSDKVDCELVDHLIATNMNSEDRGHGSVRRSSIDSTRPLYSS
ncbi:hypothetical protein C0Q70_05554 [Pomacea canaliculata]|uniref:Uncharacterized protein n=1 Tax=Pomacea canaliculata TaxID=400727 RepID=A0A2T7PLH7_POMCA|nr:hypothetical protein C0Q70_05554 [Pomacea canaliculata]